MDRGAWGLAGYSPWGYKDSDTTERLALCNSELCDTAKEARGSAETMCFI